MRIRGWSSDVCSSYLFESASSEHGIPIDEARRLVRTSVERWNEEVLREFAHPEPSPARVRSLKGVLNSLRHLFAPLFSSLEDARKMFDPDTQDIQPCAVGSRWAILFTDRKRTRLNSSH